MDAHNFGQLIKKVYLFFFSIMLHAHHLSSHTPKISILPFIFLSTSSLSATFYLSFFSSSLCNYFSPIIPFCFLSFSPLPISSITRINGPPQSSPNRTSQQRNPLWRNWMQNSFLWRDPLRRNCPKSYRHGHRIFKFC